MCSSRGQFCDFHVRTEYNKVASRRMQVNRSTHAYMQFGQNGVVKDMSQNGTFKCGKQEYNAALQPLSKVDTTKPVKANSLQSKKL